MTLIQQISKEICSNHLLEWTVLAKRLATIMPPQPLVEALKTTKIHSVSGKINDHTALMTRRPFRSPHHSISDVMFINSVADNASGRHDMSIKEIIFIC
jgi:magnesium chelatase family protein